MTAYGIQAADLNGSQIAGVLDGEYDPREANEREESSGTLHNTAFYGMRTAPRASIRSRDIQQLATLLSGNADVPYVAIGASTHLYRAKKNTTAPGYDSASEHRRITPAGGGVVLASLGYRPGGFCEAATDWFFAGTDGDTDPMTIVDNVALPTQPTFQNGYVGSALTVGGSSLAQINSIDIGVEHRIENNVQEECYDLGLPYPIELAMPGARGSIIITCEIETQDLTFDPAGGDVVFTMRRLASGALSGADTVVATLKADRQSQTSDQGSHGTPHTQRIRCVGVYDGVTKPFTLTP